MRLSRWLEAQEVGIAARWYQELRSASAQVGEEGDALLKRVADQMVSLIPGCFGEGRETGLEVWQSAAHLYGSLAFRRGLAAGEVVEELQLLRNVILRTFLLGAPPGGGGDGLRNGIPPLDLLTLNRVLDLAVSRASIAYVDDLFFAHLQGSGVSEGITSEWVEEMDRQLEGFRMESGRKPRR